MDLLHCGRGLRRLSIDEWGAACLAGLICVLDGQALRSAVRLLSARIAAAFRKQARQRQSSSREFAMGSREGSAAHQQSADAAHSNGVLQRAQITRRGGMKWLTAPKVGAAHRKRKPVTQARRISLMRRS
jgi:hypothetical protein